MHIKSSLNVKQKKSQKLNHPVPVSTPMKFSSILQPRNDACQNFTVLPPMAAAGVPFTLGGEQIGIYEVTWFLSADPHAFIPLMNCESVQFAPGPFTVATLQKFFSMLKANANREEFSELSEQELGECLRFCQANGFVALDQKIGNSWIARINGEEILDHIQDLQREGLGHSAEAKLATRLHDVLRNHVLLEKFELLPFAAIHRVFKIANAQPHDIIPFIKSYAAKHPETAQLLLLLLPPVETMPSEQLISLAESPEFARVRVEVDLHEYIALRNETCVTRAKIHEWDDLCRQLTQDLENIRQERANE